MTLLLAWTRGRDAFLCCDSAQTSISPRAPVFSESSFGQQQYVDGFAVQEGVLRRSFQRNGEYLDQALWSVLEEDWRHAKVIWGGEVTLN